MNCENCNNLIDKDDQSKLCLKCKLDVSSSSDTDSKEDVYKRVYEKTLKKKLPKEYDDKMEVDIIEQNDKPPIYMNETINASNNNVENTNRSTMKVIDETIQTNKQVINIPIQIQTKVEEKKLDTNYLSLETDFYTIKFHIFIPPEYNFEKNQFDFGISSSYHQWGENGYIPLTRHKKIDDGYVYTGVFKFSKHEIEIKHYSTLEYKYALLYDDEGERMVLYEHIQNNRRLDFHGQSNTNVINRYDGIMLPSNDGYKNSWSWKKIKKGVSNFIKNFGSKDMIKTYKKSIVAAMVYELIDYIALNEHELMDISKIIKYLNSVLKSLRQLFNTHYNCFENNPYKDNLETLFIKQITDYCFPNDKYHQYSAKLFSLSLSLHIFSGNLHKINQLNNAGTIKYPFLMEYLKISNNEQLENASKCLSVSTLSKMDLIEPLNYLYTTELKFYKESINIVQIVILLQVETKNLFEEDYFAYENDNFREYSFKNFSHIIQTNELRSYLDTFDKISPVLVTLCFSNLIMKTRDETNFQMFKLYQVLLFLALRISEHKKNSNYYSYHSTLRMLSDNEKAKTVYHNVLIKTINDYKTNFSSEDSSNKIVFNQNNYILDNFDLVRKMWKDKTIRIEEKILELFIFTCYNKWNDWDQKTLLSFKLNGYFKAYRVREQYGYNFDRKWLRLWDCLLKTSDTTNEEIKEIVQNIIKEDFHFKLYFLNLSDLIILCEDFNSIDSSKNKYHDLINEFMFQEILNKINGDIRHDVINKLVSLSNYSKYSMSSLADRILRAKWPSIENDETISKFLFENVAFLKTFFLIDSNARLDNDFLQEKLIQSRSLISSIVTILTSGQISTNLLGIIHKHNQQFIELCLIFKDDFKEILKSRDDKLIHYLLQKLLDHRYAELTCCQEFLQSMSHFNQFIGGFGQNLIDFNNLNNDIQRLNNSLKKNVLREVINVLKLDEVKQFQLSGLNRNKYLTERIKKFDDIPRAKLELIDKLIKMSSNAILNYYLCDNLNIYNQNKSKQLSIEDFLELIVINAFNRWNDLAKKLIDGTICLKDLNDLLKVCNQNWTTEFCTIMESQKVNGDLMNLRLKQIITYIQIKAISKTTNVLIRIVNENDLKGNFKVLNEMELTVKNANFDSKRIKDIDDKILNLFSKLNKLNDAKKIKCLEAFADNIKFVDWLRNQAKSLKDLRLLAEFASESENEGPLEVRRIQTLLLVGTSYAPLIYDLKQNADENDLLQACERVCSNLDSNPSLADGINAIAKEKSWLEDIKEARRNASASSLKQAMQINDKGEYIISLNDDYFDEFHKIDLKNLIKLEVLTDKDDQISLKKYDFIEVTDLQDKLTLVVGEEHQEVIKYFENILESIIDLTRLFIELLKSGNILFKNWSLRVYCDRKSSTTVKANFGLKNENNLKNIIGLRIHENDTVSSVHKIRDYLKDCYDEWIQHINKKRNDYPLLNYFTIQQLTLLRSKLNHVNQLDSKSINNIRYLTDILFNINPNCNLELIQRANVYANHQVMNNNQNTTQEENLNEINDIINDLKSQGFLLDLIREALQQNSRSNFDDLDEYRVALLDYCIQNELKPRIVNTQSRNSYDSLRLESIFDDMVHDQDSLEAKLQSVWSTFKQTLNKNLSNFLCLNHIGSFLNFLREQSNQQKIKRIKPAYLELNVPNIIICGQHELYSRVLEIYALSSEQPLPNDDEILFCSETTTAEDIEIFLKRVFLNKANEEEKIYSIVNIHNLAYEQSIKLIYLYDQLTAENSNFTLALFCAQEKEDKSILVTSFNRYYKKLTRKVDYEVIEKYLRNHFVSNVDSNVEKDGLSCRLIKSDRAGTGKSLYIQRLLEKMLTNSPNSKYNCISVKSKILDGEDIFNKLKMFDIEHHITPRLFHFDIAYEVLFNVDSFLFQLLCMSVIHSSNGELWRRSRQDLYLIEIMSPKIESKNIYLHSLLHIIPTINCATPVEVYSTLQNGITASKDTYASFDDLILKSELIQRPCQYLNSLDLNANLDTIHFKPNELLDSLTCLRILLRHSEIQNPSWSELVNFSKFLNIQLADSEQSIFCNLPEDLPGFKTFVIKFMIQMSHDFALPSLVISDKSSLQITSDDINFDIDQIQMRKKWEENPHPYLFFNPDGNTFTFLGFNVDSSSGQFININSPNRDIIFDDLKLSRHLIEAINRNARGILNEDISQMSKFDKISKILRVMGKSWAQDNQYDPDSTYELTMDNILKIMAIYMRFRCNIPVIIMGETGCGKTRLIRYLCDLQKDPNKNASIENMYLVKVHGGLGTNDIITHVKNAIDLAQKNKKLDKDMFTILFFDEANSTEAIGTIKEVMCDQRVNGELVNFNDYGLKIIAACNPYKKHSQEIINKFKQAGLGFYEGLNNDVHDKLGSLPMRELVYRVQPLPASMLPMIWDFGQLNDQVESLYISQIVDQCTINNELSQFKDLIVKLLSLSQRFMREQRDECSFVSLRDIQRVLRVLQWFLNHKVLFTSDDTHILNSIIHSLNACYHVSLQYSQTRQKYRRELVTVLRQVFANVDENYLLNEIDRLYKLFLDSIDLPDAIARNQALKENVFMIIICIELKIPLFIIGKPGSSKTLAKTLVAHKMQGSNKNEKNIFNHLKEAHLITFQCSPLSTSETIIKTFRYCSKYQLERHTDLDKYVSVVVLDEIGLAEASKSMPLKSLHPLLEDGVYFEPDEEAKLAEDLRKANSEWRKIGFMGISNWVLDPAKMNRGVFVNRCSPDLNELRDIATGICKNDSSVIKIIDPFLQPLADGFVNICKTSQEKHREFFGLRDFYSLIKMIYYEIKLNKGLLDGYFFQKSIRRNFGGLPDLNPLNLFLNEFDKCKLPITFDVLQSTNIIGLIREALDRKSTEYDNRYVLLIAQNENAIDLLKHYILDDEKDIKIIFGSSFPNDQSYSQICRQIHQIKLCMETGKTVILLNLETLYESLYDALNQFYYRFGDNEKFVDLGLGTQRVKCLVHDNFRLIVVSDKKNVYNSNKFPIPLVNRLEKHCLSMDLILDDKKLEIVREIEAWSNKICSITKLKIGDVFIGYTEDTISSLVLKICNENSFNFDDYYEWSENKQAIVDKTKEYLLQCATFNGIIQIDDLLDLYFNRQAHNCFKQFIEKHQKLPNFIQITTHSKLLSHVDLPSTAYQIESLLAFNTKQQFEDMLKKYFNDDSRDCLIIQCDCGNFYQELINCTRFIIIEQFLKYSCKKTCLLIVQIPKISGGFFSGFQCNEWLCYHIDELKDDLNFSSIFKYKGKQLSEIYLDDEIKESLLSLLESSIYNICSKIIDLKSNKGKTNSNIQDRVVSIRRVETLINLFKQKDLGFKEILFDKIIKLQKDKEEQLESAYRSNDWLTSKEVFNNIMKYGTLKQTCKVYIEDRISELAAGLIAYIDTNFNLDILINEEQKWLKDLWFKLFTNDEFLNFNYSKYYSNRNKHEFYSINSIDNTKRLRIPFSWLIKDFIDDLISPRVQELTNKDMLNIDDDFQTTPRILFNQLSNVFKESYQYKVLNESLDTNTEEFVDNYIRDFLILNQISNNHSNELINVISYRLMYLIRLDITKDLTKLESLVAIHLSFIKAKNEFELLTKFIDKYPILINTIRTDSNYESNLCFISAKYVFDKIIQFEKDMNVNKWNEWFTNISNNSALIESFMKQLNSLNRSSDKINDDNKKTLIEFRTIWEKVKIIKMFIENVCKPQNNDQYYIWALRLWNYLKSPVDFKKKPTIESFFNFFQLTLKNIKATYSQQQGKCSNCEQAGELKSIENCKCELCDKCVTQVNSTLICPSCGLVYKQNELKFYEINKYKKIKSDYSKLKATIDKFFIEIITYLAFNNNSSPDRDATEFLVNKVIKQNELELSASVKLNLIRLLIKFNCDHFNAYESPNVSLIYINAYEDYLFDNHENNFDGLLVLVNELNNNIQAPVTIERLTNIAKIRYCLTRFAEFLINFNPSIRDHLEIARKFNEFVQIVNSQWLIYFLLKQIYRKSSKDKLISLSKIKELRWILPNFLRTESLTNVPDSYVLFGNSYVKHREEVTQSILLNKTNELEFQKGIQNGLINYLAMFKISKVSNLIETNRNQCEILLTNLKRIYPELESLHRIIEHLPSELLNQHKTLSLLMIHMLSTILYSKNTLFESFKELYCKPDKYAQRLFPTMPEDEDYNTFMAFKQTYTAERYKCYSCPKGHLYIIVDCTRPSQPGRCKECNAPIGQKEGAPQHTLADGNKLVEEINDKTQKGYCLNESKNQSIRGVRLMNRFETLTMRLILSCVLYMCSIKENNNIHYLTPNLKDKSNLNGFFLRHILNDFISLSNHLQKSIDECILLIHYIIYNAQIHPVNVRNPGWQTKESRQQYEVEFCNSYLKNININQVITDLTIKLRNDIQTDHLFKIAYEEEVPNVQNISTLVDYLNNSNYWLFRNHISIEHMKSTFFATKQNNFKILNEFIDKLEQLETIKNLPLIVNMLNLIFILLNRQIDRQEARKMTIKDLIDNMNLNKKSTEILINGSYAFSNAWKTTKFMFKGIFIKTIDSIDFNNSLLDSNDYLNELPIIYYLSSTSKEGRYIYSLIFYLSKVQNEFLSFIRNELNIIDEMQHVDISNISQNDCISFDIGKDLKQIIDINATYAQDSSIQYDFSSIQSAIIQQIVAKKSYIENKELFKFEFCDDISDINKTKKLKDNVQQIELENSMKDEINSFYKQPNQITNILRILRIVFDFVVNSGCKRDTKIMEYAVNVLKMNITDTSDICIRIYDLDMKYLKSLWSSLCLYRAILLTDHGQDPFDRLSSLFKKEIENNLKQDDFYDQLILNISKNKKFINKQNLKLLINVLYELITTKLMVNSNVSDDTSEDPSATNNAYANYNIADILEVVYDENDYLQNEELQINQFNLEGFKGEHAYLVWKLLVKLYLKKD